MSKKKPMLSVGADWFCAIIGIASSFSVHFIGDLYLGEILLVLTLPMMIVLRGKRVLRIELRAFYWLLALWLLGLVIADAYNHTPMRDRMRGVALIVFFAINIVGMTILLSHNEKRKVLFFTGLMVGSLASVRLQPSPAFSDYPWKFGYASGALQLVVLLSCFFYARRRYVMSGALILGLCAVNLLLNFRSPVLGLLLTLVMVYPIIPERIGNLQILPQSQWLRLLVLAVLATGAAEAAKGMIDYVTKAGYINEEAQAKNEAQSKGGNLLLGGRPEFQVGLRAALDRPIIGHGSWAKDMKYFEMFYDMSVENGTLREQYGGDIEEEADGLIPGHSHIITAWVWAGIAGLIFWLYVLYMVCRGMIRVALFRPPLAPVYMTFLIGMFWDIFFSPFAANRRMNEAVLIVIIADLVELRAPAIQRSWRRLGAVGVNRVVVPHDTPEAPGLPS